MRTTLIISDKIVGEIKAIAAKQKQTFSKTVESLLRLGLGRAHPTKSKMKPLPAFRAGGALVDVADRNALYTAMEKK